MAKIDTTRRGVAGWGLIAGLVAFGGVGLVAVPFFGLMVMNSDSCRAPDERPICDPGNQQLVANLPMGALAVGLLLAAVGGGLAARRRRSSAPWQLGAWLLLLVAGMVSCGIATAGPSPEYERRQAEEAARRQAERVDRLLARPDYEVMRPRFEEMQHRIQNEVRATLPAVDWPLLLDDTLDYCGGGNPRAKSITDSTMPDAKLTDEQWVALDAVVRRVAADYGFSGPPLRLPPANAPKELELQGPDGASLQVRSTGASQFRVTFESACYLPAAERARLPSRQPVTR